MKQYLEYLNHVMKNGAVKQDRTGTGTRSVFGYQMRYNLQEGFPLVTTKKVHIKSIVQELLWFLRGETNIASLKECGVSIWNEWANPEGELGPVYGKQWRDWISNDGRHIDQIQQVMDLLKTDPDSRRIIVSAWNVGDLDKMALMPCHAFFQFYTVLLHEEERVKLAVKKGVIEPNSETFPIHLLSKQCDLSGIPTRRLDCQLYQRSADSFLGVPFNIASYALLTHMIAHQMGMLPGEMIWTGGDCHIYSNHITQVETQLQRGPLPLPELRFARKPDSIFDYKYEDFVFENYQSYESIKASVAV